jgi:D-xylose transport system permease protein
MASLDNSMPMLDVDTYWQTIIKGRILTLAVWLDVATRTGRRQSNRCCFVLAPKL